MPRKVILDVDTGVDDALALLLALRSPELEVLGVTCVAGNTTIERVVLNTLCTLDVARSTVPVAAGARKPLVAPLRTATYFHGSNGLADVELPPPSHSAVDEDAPSFMTRAAREQPGEITVVTLGPLTNVALAVLRDPQFAGNLEGLVIMGGAVSHPGNASGAAEANFGNDPEAASVVAACGASIQLVDLGATAEAVLPLSELPATGNRTLSPVANLAQQLLRFYGPVCMTSGAAGAVLHDPLAVGLAALPDLATFVPMSLEIETGGTLTRGACVVNFSGLLGRVEVVSDHLDVTGMVPVPLNASVARRIETDRFLDIFLERLELA